MNTKRTYFVMLSNQNGTLLISLTELNGDLAMFENKSAARAAGESNPFGEAFGYYIFDAMKSVSKKCN